MGNEAGTWIMYGVDHDDPECLHSVDDAIEYINKVGFLPLFRGEIPGFSLEERTEALYWWSGDVKRDPWEWREIIARRGGVAYGKFYAGKAGFVSREWLPRFVNVRRDGYDFDALYEDGKASMRQKKIMDLYADDLSDAEYYSYEIKARAGFGKGGAKGFEGTITSLQMQGYLVMRDFRQRVNKNGESYGWPVAVYSTPEHIFGHEHVRSAYSEAPAESARQILAHMREIYPVATDKQVAKMLGVKL